MKRDREIGNIEGAPFSKAVINATFISHLNNNIEHN